MKKTLVIGSSEKNLTDNTSLAENISETNFYLGKKSKSWR